MPLFGEIVEPVSRALYIDESSDEEDNLEDSGTNVTKVNWEDDTPSSPATILVFYGQLAADFLQKVLHGLNPKSAAHLKEKLLSRNKVPKELNLQIYKLSNGIYGCFCPNVDIGKSSSLVLEELVPIFKRCNQVIVVCSLPAPFFKGNDSTLDLPSAFMRALYTSTFDQKDVVAPLLESPNLVTGVPASILSWCEVFDKPGCLYVSYTDSPHLDSISAEPLVNVFSSVGGGVFKTNVLSFQSAIPEPSSNLYI
ncbi:Proteasome assembly chaperone 1 [Frankliniella fusca]|uniref:Proteasome assembly chaperone 1 n=1 Tax=Frankliniella fusca TaxID=407009 RepID=A0AAE1HSD0_9NEOP|nr:Proteasome assembly chaperone 1 [Frankliniella fusca]